MEGDLTCAQANGLDLIRYLESLGFLPQKIRGEDYWFLSPLRDEKTPSFKVARKTNLWYDHGFGNGGDLIDFGVLFHRCSIREFLQKLTESKELNFSFQPPITTQQKEIKNAELSDFFDRNKHLYYDNLMVVRRKNDLRQWLLFFLVAVKETAEKAASTL